MSWKSAQEEAARWLDRLQLKNSEIRGAVVDLRPYAHLVKAEAQYRAMIFEAAKRLLKKRGAVAILPPDPRGEKSAISSLSVEPSLPPGQREPAGGPLDGR